MSQVLRDEARSAVAGRWPAALKILEEVDVLDHRALEAASSTETPALDPIMRWLTQAATYSRLSIGEAAVLSMTLGRRGRRAARHSLAAVAFTSVVSNAIAKSSFRRERPEGGTEGSGRRVSTPISSSFPSGHTAAAVSLTTLISAELPTLIALAYTIAALFAYSRVHVGVHYPSDVIAGAILGASMGALANGVFRRSNV